MKLPPSNYTAVELQNQKDDELINLMNKLEIMDKNRSRKYLIFYSTDNPSLEEILSGTAIVSRAMSPDIPPVEWSFLAIYNIIEHFRSFDFIEQLNLNDKVL
uniref:NR LBD domain-containing protein n=1 Tax=Caenorhabditis tropicalis TaxID=1561998 RepID=A0A1I7TAV4_9PELO